jgi:AraC-like DNA-binding protein
MRVSTAFLRTFQGILRELGLQESALVPLPTAAESLGWDECQKRLALTLRHAEEPALGLRVGERISVSALHVVGHLMRAGTTLREATDQFSRFAPLVWAGAAFVLRERGDEAAFGFRPPSIDRAGERFCTEAALTAIVHVITAAHPSGRAPLRVELAYPPPDHDAEYPRAFGCPVVFDCEWSCVVFPYTMLDERRHMAGDPLKLRLFERAERLLATKERGRDVVLRVSEALRSVSLERFDAESVARTLGMSPRALRHKLRERGASFAGLVNDARRELACEALRCAS